MSRFSRTAISSAASSTRWAVRSVTGGLRNKFNLVEIDHFNRLEIEAFESPGQPGREGDETYDIQKIQEVADGGRP